MVREYAGIDFMSVGSNCYAIESDTAWQERDASVSA